MNPLNLFFRCASRIAPRVRIPPQIALPWLVVHGEADRIAPVQGSHVLFERLGSQDKQLMVYPGLRHEVHNEKAADRARFLDLLSDWIIERARR